ncbi:MAG: hypothetical protein ACLTG4_06885 [Oscillospiraceae bacterium]
MPLSRHCAVAGPTACCCTATFTTREIRIVTACDALAERLPKLFRRAFGALACRPGRRPVAAMC